MARSVASRFMLLNGRRPGEVRASNSDSTALAATNAANRNYRGEYRYFSRSGFADGI